MSSKWWKNIVSTVAFTATACCFCSFKIEEMMTPEQREYTGIAHLTPRELSLLNEWLNSKMIPLEIPSSTLSTKSILNDGKLLVLSDESLYEVSPTSFDIVKKWYYSYPVILMDSSNTDYPVKILNTFTGESILVKRLR